MSTGLTFWEEHKEYENKYKMTREYQKVLTDMIGEKYHDWHEKTPTKFVGCNVCVCGFKSWYEAVEKHITNSNRSFTTDHDMMKVRMVLREKGLWELVSYYISTYAMKEGCTRSYELIAFMDENAERFNCLVAQCKMEGVV